MPVDSRAPTRSPWTRTALLTLWGELLALVNSSLRDDILCGYPSPAGTLVAAKSSLLVLTSSHRIHHVRVDLVAPPAHVLALTVVHDMSPKAIRACDLMRELTDRVGDRGVLAAALRRRGITGRLGAADLALVPASRPLLYRWSEVPGICRADAGVGELEYNVALDPDVSLDGSALGKAAAMYGLERLVRHSG